MANKIAHDPGKIPECKVLHESACDANLGMHALTCNSSDSTSSMSPLCISQLIMVRLLVGWWREANDASPDLQ